MATNLYKKALTRKPPKSMAQGITTQSAPVDFEQAQSQHQNYICQLEKIGLNVTTLPPEELHPDSHFVEDTTIVHNNVAILTRPGAQTRRGEVACIKPHLQHLFSVEDLGGDDETLVDGGDILFVDNRVLIGIYDRTNLKGAKRLKEILHVIDNTLEVIFVEFTGVLHLKSGLTALNENVLIGNPLIKLNRNLDFIDIKWLPIAEAYAANTLTINKHTLYFKEAKNAKDIIAASGNIPIPMELNEFRKMDGSFTCLSLIW